MSHLVSHLLNDYAERGTSLTFPTLRSTRQLIVFVRLVFHNFNNQVIYRRQTHSVAAGGVGLQVEFGLVGWWAPQPHRAGSLVKSSLPEEAGAATEVPTTMASAAAASAENQTFNFTS
jgi:hypothetical protein